jgi:hypothetical protein
MTDDTANLILTLLRRMDDKLDRAIGDIQDLKQRMTSLEQRVALLHEDFAGQSLRIDRIDIRLDRIERRRDLVATP